MDDVKELAEEFARLIQERDSIPFHKQETNARCVEIDDKLIPLIISQVPRGKMEEFNTLINSILTESSQENKIPPLEEGIDPSWINSFKGCI